LLKKKTQYEKQGAEERFLFDRSSQFPAFRSRSFLPNREILETYLALKRKLASRVFHPTRREWLLYHPDGPRAVRRAKKWERYKETVSRRYAKSYVLPAVWRGGHRRGTCTPLVKSPDDSDPLGILLLQTAHIMTTSVDFMYKSFVATLSASPDFLLGIFTTVASGLLEFFQLPAFHTVFSFLANFVFLLIVLSYPLSYFGVSCATNLVDDEAGHGEENATSIACELTEPVSVSTTCVQIFFSFIFDTRTR
jgi:hypothetical protein